MTHIEQPGHSTAPTSAEEMSGEEFWDRRYSESTQIWSGNPNAALVAMIRDRATGTALDVGCGEGADAIWLAEKGWAVTGIDISQLALDRAQEAAQRRQVGKSIAWQRLDLTSDSPQGEFNLVSAIFLQSPIGFPREAILRRLCANVAPGGLLLIVGHAKWPPWSRHAEHDAQRPDPLNAAETLAALELDEGRWLVEQCADQTREVTAPDGTPVELIDALVLARRIH